MFLKSKTEADRQRLFDEYMLSILKEREVIKKNKKIIEEKGFSYDQTINEDKMKVHSIVMWIVLSSRIF